MRARNAAEVAVAAFQKQAHIAHRAGVGVVGGQPFHARSQAAMDVILQARLGMVARQIHLAGRHQKMAVNEVHQAMRQVAGKIRAVVSGAVLAQAARDVNARILFGGQLDVRIGLVVAQQDVEARLPLLDEVVLERQRFFFVVDQNVIDVGGFGDERAGLGIGQAVVVEVAAHAEAQALGLADVDHPSAGVLVKVHAGRERQLGRFVTQIHRGGRL
jgi:hypothetical protein